MAATKMATHTDPAFERSAASGAGGFGLRLRAVAGQILRYGLALIFLWFGAMKFTDYEAAGIAPFILNSPLVGWWHVVFGVQGASYMLGCFEITTGVLLALRPIAPRLAVIGGAMAVITFLITLTFFFTTPGVAEPRAGGFPAISAEVGQFLLKDVGLLGISLWLLGDAIVALDSPARPVT